jgi:hypothetical protein
VSKINQHAIMKKVYKRLNEENKNSEYIFEQGPVFAVAEKPAKYKPK